MPFLGEKGDVLICHSRLIHRGSNATPGHRLRKSPITYYSGINHRPDMLVTARDASGGAYAVFDGPELD